MGAIMLLMLLAKAASYRPHTAVCKGRMLGYVRLSTSDELTLLSASSHSAQYCVHNQSSNNTTTHVSTSHTAASAHAL